MPTLRGTAWMAVSQRSRAYRVDTSRHPTAGLLGCTTMNGADVTLSAETQPPTESTQPWEAYAHRILEELKAGHPSFGATDPDELLPWQREISALWALNLESCLARSVGPLLAEIDRLRAIELTLTERLVHLDDAVQHLTKEVADLGIWRDVYVEAERIGKDFLLGWVPGSPPPIACSACGLRIDGVLGYVCVRNPCPTGLAGPTC